MQHFNVRSKKYFSFGSLNNLSKVFGNNAFFSLNVLPVRICAVFQLKIGGNMDTYN